MDIRSLSVLLVDDDHDDQFFFKEALKQVEHPVDLSIASGTLEAIDKIKTVIPHIVFLDINMPVKSGKECLKIIRNNPEFDPIKIIMFTTSTSEIDVEECFANGADLYITKPLSTVEQSKILKRVFTLYLSDQLFKPHRASFVFNLYVN